MARWDDQWQWFSGNCVGATLCPWYGSVIFGRNMATLRGIEKEKPKGGGFWGCCLLDCLLLDMGALNVCHRAWRRGNLMDSIKEKNDGFGKNCCLHCWCGPCALDQEQRALEYYQQEGERLIGAPQAPSQMNRFSVLAKSV